ncbi:MAG: folylpolyglutamate synthase/dihydrofolate synthase family protein [Thermodesulfobacteriota bacterium]|nr:folylpolyglutamate synthase/dihydrofolate synthase family protein [Thermodesulfobacteriota bacterium]
MTQIDLYHSTLKSMYSLRRFGIKLGLSTIRKILTSLGNPQHNFSCIHLAGTNGKGSVASSLASILNASGYKTGLYTSPHLVRFNERITVDRRPITDDRVVESYQAVKQVHHGNREPTFFELTTAMAFYEFSRQKVNWAVIETGMGGRLDATNIINPALSIITNISVEHREYLGNTIAEIASEKGGIIKSRIPVVTGIKQKSAVSVVKKIAREKQADFFLLGDHFRVKRSKSGTFTYFGMDRTWRNLQTGLLGNYQVDNAALAVAACEVLNRKKANISIESIRQGLTKNHWPGRLEVVCQDPFILLDGAHNLIAARNLARYLSNNLSNRPITLVVGILDDKPYQAMLKSLLPVCKSAIITSPKINRALAPETLSAVAKRFISHITIIPDVGKAVKYAIKNSQPGDAVCIAGSLYVVGEAKEALEKIAY